MKRFGIVCALSSAALVAACAMPWEVADVQAVIDAPPASGGTPFTRALFSEYQSLTRTSAMVDYNWVDAAFFAGKASRAAGGEAVAPENPLGWDVPADRIGELSAARSKLDADFTAGAQDRHPELAAKAQVAFDCWLDREEEGDATSECRSLFFKTEAALQPRKTGQLGPAIAPPAQEAKVLRRFEIYFDLNQSSLGRDADRIVAEIAAARAALAPATIRVTGHTDTTGNPAHNLKLSAARAHSVAAALARRGIVSEESAVGQTGLAVPTAEGTPETRNRRVVIELIK